MLIIQCQSKTNIDILKLFDYSFLIFYILSMLTTKVFIIFITKIATFVSTSNTYILISAAIIPLYISFF